MVKGEVTDSTRSCHWENPSAHKFTINTLKTIMPRKGRTRNESSYGACSLLHHCLQLPSLTMSAQKSIRALSPNSNRLPLPFANPQSRTVRQSWKIHSVLISVGAPSILDMAMSQPRFHSSRVHLVRRLTMTRLLLITVPSSSSKQWVCNL